MSGYHRTPYREGELRYGRLYRIWCGMKVRCDKPRFKFYYRYGGRGITICDEWHSFVSFREWAMSHGYDDTLSIDRINNDGNYEPSNCRWVDRVENTRLANVHKKMVGGGGCILNIKQASEIKRLLASGSLTQKQIGDRYGINDATVGSIKRGVCWPDAEPAGPVGEQRKRKRLTADSVLQIKALLRQGGFRYREIGQRFGVSKKAIQLIKTGRTWSSVQLPVFCD